MTLRKAAQDMLAAVDELEQAGSESTEAWNIAVNRMVIARINLENALRMDALERLAEADRELGLGY